MEDRLVNRLEAMYANDEILGYLSNHLSGEKLKAGWIEQGLVAKGIKGNLVDKENQERYVIPLSITMRAVIDRGINSSGDAGIIILGEQGLTCEKFVVAFRNDSYDESLQRTISAFWIKGYTPNEITRLFLKHELGSGLLTAFDEPGIDYIEYLRDQITAGICEESFSIMIPSNWEKSRNWISDILKENSSDLVLLGNNYTKNSIALALLLSNWIKDMKEVIKIDKIVGACFFIRGNTSESFFWDGPRDILTTAVFTIPKIEKLAMNILYPLWEKSEIPFGSTHESSSITGETPLVSSTPIVTPTVPIEYEEIADRARGLIGKIDVEDTFRRIERIESILGELEHMQDQEEEKTTPSHPNLMESRIKDALDSLEEITQRLQELEERIVRVCKEIE